MIAILPRGGSQGAGEPAQFEADVDDADAVTVPYGSAGGASSYQYVSASIPETITLFVADSDYDCTFDIELTWLAQGQTHTTVLTNGGKHFKILGSTGLPWYSGDPGLGVKLAFDSGHPFSYHAP